MKLEEERIWNKFHTYFDMGIRRLAALVPNLFEFARIFERKCCRSDESPSSLPLIETFETPLILLSIFFFIFDFLSIMSALWHVDFMNVDYRIDGSLPFAFLSEVAPYSLFYAHIVLNILCGESEIKRILHTGTHRAQ